MALSINNNDNDNDNDNDSAKILLSGQKKSGSEQAGFVK
jgi:hypothetical protein